MQRGAGAIFLSAGISPIPKKLYVSAMGIIPEKRPSDRSVGITALLFSVLSLGISGAMNVWPEQKMIGWVAIGIAAFLLVCCLFAFFQGRAERRRPKSKLRPDPTPAFSVILIIVSVVVMMLALVIAANAHGCASTGVRIRGIHNTTIEGAGIYGFDCGLRVDSAYNSIIKFLSIGR